MLALVILYEPYMNFCLKNNSTESSASLTHAIRLLMLGLFDSLSWPSCYDAAKSCSTSAVNSLRSLDILRDPRTMHVQSHSDALSLFREANSSEDKAVVLAISNLSRGRQIWKMDGTVAFCQLDSDAGRLRIGEGGLLVRSIVAMRIDLKVYKADRCRVFCLSVVHENPLFENPISLNFFNNVIEAVNVACAIRATACQHSTSPAKIECSEEVLAVLSQDEESRRKSNSVSDTESDQERLLN